MLVMTLHKLPRTKVSGAAAWVAVMLWVSTEFPSRLQRVTVFGRVFLPLGLLRTFLRAVFVADCLSKHTFDVTRRQRKLLPACPSLRGKVSREFSQLSFLPSSSVLVKFQILWSRGFWPLLRWGAAHVVSRCSTQCPPPLCSECFI